MVGQLGKGWPAHRCFELQEVTASMPGRYLEAGAWKITQDFLLLPPSLISFLPGHFGEQSGMETIAGCFLS